MSETSTERYQIAATGLTVAVPAGTFEDCVLVRGAQPRRARTPR